LPYYLMTKVIARIIIVL